MTPPIYQTITDVATDNGGTDPGYSGPWRLCQEIRFYVDGVLRKEIFIDDKQLPYISDNSNGTHFFTDSAWAAFGSPGNSAKGGPVEFGRWANYDVYPYFIGQQGPINLQPYRGFIDEIVLWREGLSQPQIADRASNNPTLQPVSSFDGRWYKLDETLTASGAGYQSIPTLKDQLLPSNTGNNAFFVRTNQNPLNGTNYFYGGDVSNGAGLKPHSSASLFLNAYTKAYSIFAVNQTTGLMSNGNIPPAWGPTWWELDRGITIRTQPLEGTGAPSSWANDPLINTRPGFPSSTEISGATIEFLMKTNQSAFDMKIPVWEQVPNGVGFYLSSWITPTKHFLMRFITSDYSGLYDHPILYFLPDGSLRWGDPEDSNPFYDTLVWNGPVNDNQTHHIAITICSLRIPKNFVLPN